MRLKENNIRIWKVDENWQILTKLETISREYFVTPAAHSCQGYTPENGHNWYISSRFQHMYKIIISSKYFFYICQPTHKNLSFRKTLPEAQRTQSIDSISWENLSARIVQDWFQWHYLNKLQIWSPDGATWITSKFGHQIALLALVPNLVTRSHHLH